MNSASMRRWSWEILGWAAGLLFLLALWQGAVAVWSVPEYLLPAPTRILASITEHQQQLARHSWVTLGEIAAGFALGAAGAFVMALGMHYSRALEKAAYPALILCQVTPKIAVAPLFIIWFGYGTLPKVLIAALVSFFPILVNTVKGLNTVDRELDDLLYSLSATRLQALLKVRIPSSLPYVFAGLKVAVTLSVVGAIVGEFVGANQGLGYVIMISNANLDTPMVFAAILLLSVMGIALFLLFCFLETLVNRQKTVGLDF